MMQEPACHHDPAKQADDDDDPKEPDAGRRKPIPAGMGKVVFQMGMFMSPA